MAGDWIKMRGMLLQSPKLIAMARRLHGEREFRDWLTPGGRSIDGQVVGDDALRCVTCALLLRVWSAAREHGKYVGNDLFLAAISIADLDVMAGVRGFGEAMRSVDWARESRGPSPGVTLPNFKEHNVPKTAAEKQQAYRRRAAAAESDAAESDAAARYAALPARYQNVTPTVQDSTEGELHSPSTPFTPEPSPARGESPAAGAGNAPSPPEPEDRPVLLFPVVGGKGDGGRPPADWPLTAAKLAEYRESYPGIDALAECRKALQWTRDNPDRRKTRRGMPAFLGRWLARAQDRDAANARPQHANGRGDPADIIRRLRRDMECNGSTNGRHDTPGSSG